MTISEHMQLLIDQADKDIRNCANSCDAYAKKHLLSKVLSSGSWEETFKEHVQCFATRRNEFELALSMHTGYAINAVNDKLDDIHDKLNTANDMLHSTDGKVTTANEMLAGMQEKCVQLCSVWYIPC